MVSTLKPKSSSLHTKGCQPRSWTPGRIGDVTGRTAGRRFTAKNPLTFGDVLMTASLPCALVTVKTHSTRHRRAFARFCEHNGIIATPVNDQSIAKDVHGRPTGYQTVYECTGGTALNDLDGLDCVASVTYTVASRVSATGTGSGPDKKVRYESRPRYVPVPHTNSLVRVN